VADVFISYRRDDIAHARLLKEALGARFAVFLDVSMDYGEPWKERIAGSFEGCRVMLVLVGPAWLDPKNLERLRDPGDWVRRELASALARPDVVRVIPLLVTGCALPEEKHLPAELHGLLGRQARWIDEGSGWDAQIEHLRGYLNEWLTVIHPGGGSPAPPARLVPYLCDRTEHEEALEGLRGTQGAAACLLHGMTADAHIQFVERLQHNGLFQGLFGASRTGVAVEFLDWNREEGRTQRWDSLLRTAIRKRLRPPGVAMPDAELAAFLTAPGRPYVLVLQVTTKDQQLCGKNLIPGLLAAWFGLFPQMVSPGEARDPPPQRWPLLLWINLTYEKRVASPSFEKPTLTLPPLRAVDDGDISRWMSLPEVRKLVAGSATTERRLLEIPKKRGWLWGPKELHMRDFAEAVEQIFEAETGT
jgi:hypothetical protein